jgi:hypothetical protein
MEIQAMSSNALGFLAAIVSNVRAAPEGLRRPCSHSCNVRTDTPRSAANSAWDRPARVRISEIAGRGLTRPIFLRLSSRNPSRISRPISRLRAGLAADLMFYFPENVRRDCFDDVLRIKSQKPYFLVLCLQKINDPNTASFATARNTPTHFPDTARARNDFSQFGISCQHLLQARVVVIGKVRLNEPREKPGLDETDHDAPEASATVRHCRIPTKAEHFRRSSSRSTLLRIRPLHEAPGPSETRQTG